MSFCCVRSIFPPSENLTNAAQKARTGNHLQGHPARCAAARFTLIDAGYSLYRIHHRHDSEHNCKNIDTVPSHPASSSQSAIKFVATKTVVMRRTSHHELFGREYENSVAFASKDLGRPDSPGFTRTFLNSSVLLRRCTVSVSSILPSHSPCRPVVEHQPQLSRRKVTKLLVEIPFQTSPAGQSGPRGTSFVVALQATARGAAPALACFTGTNIPDGGSHAW